MDIERAIKELKKELEYELQDYSSSFTIEIDTEPCDSEEDYVVLSFCIKLKNTELEFHYSANVDENYNCQIELGEDCWNDIDTEILFISMFFSAAYPDE